MQRAIDRHRVFALASDEVDDIPADSISSSHSDPSRPQYLSDLKHPWVGDVLIAHQIDQWL